MEEVGVCWQSRGGRRGGRLRARRRREVIGRSTIVLAPSMYSSTKERGKRHSEERRNIPEIS